jgi:hypothetical protein
MESKIVSVRFKKEDFNRLQSISRKSLINTSVLIRLSVAKILEQGNEPLLTCKDCVLNDNNFYKREVET